MTSTGTVVAVFIWQLDIQLSMQWVLITTDVVRISIREMCITLCDKVCQWLVTGRWVSPGTPVSSMNKTGYDITEILLKVVLSTLTPTIYTVVAFICQKDWDSSLKVITKIKHLWMMCRFFHWTIYKALSIKQEIYSWFLWVIMGGYMYIYNLCKQCLCDKVCQWP